jgi:xanthine dehydrogenase/oxidase
MVVAVQGEVNKISKKEQETKEQDLAVAVRGNLCRCTGYASIAECARRCGAGMAVEIEDCLPAPSSSATLKDPEQEWVRPVSLDAVQALRHKHGANVRYVVGNTGSGVYPVHPPAPGQKAQVAIDLSAVPELREVSVTDEGLTIGAAVPLAAVVSLLRDNAHRSPSTFPRMAEHIEAIASPALRESGSWAGNVMMQKLRGFASDFCAVALAANIGFHVSPLPGASEVTVGLDNFFDLPDDLLLVRMHIAYARAGQSFYSYRAALRPEFAHSLVCAAFLATVRDGKIATVRAAFGAVGPRPVRAKKAEAALRDKLPGDAEAAAAAIAAAAQEVKIEPDPHYHTLQQPEGKEAYRRDLVAAYTHRFLVELAGPPLAGGAEALAHAQLPRALPRTSQTVAGEPFDRSASVSHQRKEGLAHATGAAVYTADVEGPASALHGTLVMSKVAHARIVAVDASAALAAPGVVAYITAADIPGVNNLGFLTHEELFATETVHHVGQPIGFVVARTQKEADAASFLVQVTYEELPAVLTIEQALAAGPSHVLPHADGAHPVVTAGPDVEQALQSSPVVIEGTASIHSQLHMYLEKVAALACPEEQGRFTLDSATQWPDNTRTRLSEVLGLASPSDLTIRMRRAGGGFGGKTTRQHWLQAACLVACAKLRRPVRSAQTIWQDGLFTGGRHDFEARYRVGVTRTGELLALDVKSYSNGGYSSDFSPFVASDYNEHLDCVYRWPSFRAETAALRTNLPSKTAYRSFGKVQAVAVTEQIMDAVSVRLGVPLDELRRKNLYTKQTCITPNGIYIPHFHVPEMIDRLAASADVAARRREIEQFNADPRNRYRKRGLSLLPVKMGVSHQHSNGATCLISVSGGDGSVVVHHAGCELGQGIHEKVAFMVASTLGCPVPLVRVADTNTDVIPNMPSTGGSATSEINAEAARLACVELLGRLAPVRAHLEKKASTWQALIKEAAAARVNLTASASYKAPGRSGTEADGLAGVWNMNSADYYCFGVAAVEALVDVVTGEVTLPRADLLYDSGAPLGPSPAVDIGQIEGAFVQGLGYMIYEDVLFDAKGKNMSNDLWTYKPPLLTCCPEQFNVTLLQDAPFPKGIQRSKASGEPPYLMSFAAYEAIKLAVRASRLERGLSAEFEMGTPATPDRVSRAARWSKEELKV